MRSQSLKVRLRELLAPDGFLSRVLRDRHVKSRLTLRTAETCFLLIEIATREMIVRLLVGNDFPFTTR